MESIAKYAQHLSTGIDPSKKRDELMGSTTSRTASPTDEGDSTLRKRPRLSERDAWDIALAWRDQLRGWVRLGLDDQQIPSSIIPRFEWVAFVFHGTLSSGYQDITDHPQATAYARAATIVWFALSCCDGYSGAENPQFWRRVFQELLYAKERSIFSKRRPNSRPQIPITDAVRFFSHPMRPFPRIRIVVRDADEGATISSVFFGKVHHVDTARDTQLQRILTKLQPYMRKYGAMRCVPVEIVLQPPTKPTTIVRNEPSSSGTMKPTAAVSVATLMELPQLYLRSVKLLDSSYSGAHELHSLIPPSDIEVCMRGILPSFVRDHRLCRGLLDQLQAETCKEKQLRRWRITHLQVVQDWDLSYSYLSVMCSALPYLLSISTVTMPRHRYSRQPPASVASDWAWLGFAIFHPDTISLSGFNAMELDIGGITPADVADIAKMAVGNNLLGESNTGYLEGHVRSGTEVRIHPRNDNESSLFTFAAESWVSLCAPASDTTDHRDWICAVIPGFGSAWIKRRDIIDTRSRRPGASCIRTLCVSRFSEDAHKESNKEALLGLLRVLGDRVMRLQFKHSDHVSVATVRAILQACPSLKSLRIHHEGSFWADETLAMKHPRLEELELTLQGLNTSFRRLQDVKAGCLPHLKALRVISNRFGYTLREGVFVSLLSRQSALQYLHWSCIGDLTATWGNAPPYQQSKATRDILRRLSPELQFSHGPLHLNCRLAFLSVLHELAERSSVGTYSLGPDVVGLIFEYVTSSSLREICINE